MIGRSVADHAGEERVDECAAPESEVPQLDAAEPRGDRRPDLGWCARVRAVTDRAAVMDPDGTGRLDWAHRGVGPQLDQLDRLVVGQPDLDEFVALG